MQPNERLAGCLCGGCADCLRAQGERTEQCPTCEGERYVLNSDETRQAVCWTCAGRGWVVETECPRCGCEPCECVVCTGCGVHVAESACPGCPMCLECAPDGNEHHGDCPSEIAERARRALWGEA